jgi:serine/threonine protein kinase
MGGEAQLLFLVMEYVEGLNLKEFVKQVGPLPVAQACEYIRQTALGLQYLFEQAFIHRDVKPSNLMLTADRKLVKIRDNLGVTVGGRVGAAAYTAPEILQGLGCDIRADLYSLGCTFYHLLTARAPFRTDNPFELTRKQVTEEPTPVQRLRPEVPQQLANIVHILLDKSPENRYQTPAALVKELLPFCSPEWHDRP